MRKHYDLTEKERKLIDEVNRRNNRMVWVFTGVVSLFLFYLMAGDWLQASSQEEVIAEVLQDEIPDDLFENGIHMRSGLVVDSGFVQVKGNCLSCHSGKLITQNRASREGWEKIIHWMQETQDLWDLGANEAIILDYLAKNYAPQNTGRRPNLTDIEWYELED